MTTVLQSQLTLRSADFSQTIGVDTHLTSTTGPFANITQVLSDLSYIDCDHIRDRIIDIPYLAPFDAVGKAGIRLDMIVQGDPIAALSPLNALAPYLAYVEGPNEVDRDPVTYDGKTGPAGADLLQQTLYAAVHADTTLNRPGHVTPVLAFSLAPGENYAPYGNIAADADYGNIHAYGQYGCPSYWFLGPGIKDAIDTPNLPVIVTETGNYTLLNNDSGVSEAVQAKLIMNTLLDDFKAGMKLTYINELLDLNSSATDLAADDHYGLFHSDGTPKAAATALHNLTSILADSGANAASFTPTRLSYAVTGLPSNANQLAMEKSDGAYDVALWYEPWIWDKATNTEVTFASLNVTVTLGQVYQTINLYDPLTGASPIETWHNVSSVQLALNTTALILELEPDATAPAGIVIKTGAAGGVFASTGQDTVTAGSGATTVNASGSATITGSSGPLAVNFSGSSASVVGGSGTLTIVSDSGHNTIVGGSGAFSYTDLAGDDRVSTGTSASNLVTLGSGSDSVTVLGATTLLGGAGASSVTLDSSGSSITGGTGGLSVLDSVGGNMITGGGGSLSIDDEGGGDLIATGTSASNLVTLGSGSDSVTLLGVTTLLGGSGTAWVVDSVGGNSITGGSGAITVSAPVGGDVVTTNNTSGVSAVVLQVGTSTVTANGATAIIANRANLAVSGSGNLSINGGLGSITLTGGTGSDYVFTQAGTHNLLRLGSGADVVLGHGADTIDASTATGAANTYVYAAGPALVYGGAGALSVNGRNAAVTVIGGSGTVNASAAGDNSSLQGGSSGGNVLSTSASDVTLVGAGGGDTLTDAGSGNNTLVAGAGRETLAGGTGVDQFVFNKAAAPYVDMVGKFQPGVDQVSFVGFGATPIASQSVVGGNLQLVLSDHSQITFLGVTSLGA